MTTTLSRKLLFTAASGLLCCCFMCLGQDKSSPKDKAIEAARKLGIKVPVQAREWHIWWGAPLGTNPSVPAWDHWKSLKRFGKFDPTTTIEETVPGSGWRRYLNSVGYPLVGPYDSGQKDIIRWQLETARNAGLDALHIHLWPSLWDQGTDFTPLPVFERALAVAADMKYPIAVHDEIYFRNMKISKAKVLENSILRTATLIKKYGKHPGWKKVDGMPMYYFQNSNKWLKAKDMQTYMAEVEKQTGPVYWIIEMGPDPEYLRIPQVKMIFGPNVSWFLHTPPYGAGPHPWEDVRRGLAKTGEMARKYGKKFGILVYTRFNNNNDRGTPGKGRIDGEDGDFYIKSLKMAKDANPDLIIVTQWNDFEEGAFLEPAWDFDGFNGDPYRYCRITAASMGKDFTPAKLPKRDQVDPMIRHKLFGDTQKGDCGPVIKNGNLRNNTLSWKWGEETGSPTEIRLSQRKLARWSPNCPAMGPISISNPSQVDQQGTLNPKVEFRFFVPGLVCKEPTDLWLGLRIKGNGNVRIRYRSEMEIYRVDSRWDKRCQDTRKNAFINLGSQGKVYWLPLRGARFSGWEGDITLTLSSKNACEVKDVILWHPQMKDVKHPLSAATKSLELPSMIEPQEPFVACAYDKVGNPGIPRLFFKGKTTPTSAKDPMDLLKRK